MSGFEPLYFLGGIFALYIIWLLLTHLLPRLVNGYTAEEWNKILSEADKKKKKEKAFKVFLNLDDIDFRKLLFELTSIGDEECNDAYGIGVYEALAVYKEVDAIKLPVRDL